MNGLNGYVSLHEKNNIIQIIASICVQSAEWRKKTSLLNASWTPIEIFFKIGNFPCRISIFEGWNLEQNVAKTQIYWAAINFKSNFEKSTMQQDL